MVRSHRTFRVLLATCLLVLASRAHAALRPEQISLEGRLFEIKLFRFNPTDKIDLLEQYFRKNIVNFKELPGAYLETVEQNRTKVLKEFPAARRRALLRAWMTQFEADHPDLAPRVEAARLWLEWASLADSGEPPGAEEAAELRGRARKALEGLQVSAWSYLVAGLIVDLVGPGGEGEEPLADKLELWEKASEVAANEDAHLHFLLGDLLTQVLDPKVVPVYCKKLATEYEKSLLVAPSDKQLYAAVAGRYHEVYETLSGADAQLPFWFEELVFKRMIAVEPTNARAHNNLSFLYSQYGVNLAEALKEAQIANQLMPGDANLLDTLGWAYYKNGNHAKAVEVLSRALELDDASADVHFHLATVFYDLEAFDKAVEHFRATVSLDAKNAFAMNNLAYLFSEQGTNMKEGLELVDRALALQPENSAFLDTKGWLNFRLGRHDEADAFVSKAIALQPEVSELHLHKGQIALARGRYQMASDHFEKALTYEPKNQELARQLARIYALNGLQQGLTRFARIHSVQQDKQNFEVFYRAMAEVFETDRLYPDATRTMQRYLDLPDGERPETPTEVALPEAPGEGPPPHPVGKDFAGALRSLPPRTDMVVTLEHGGLVGLVDMIIEHARLPFPLSPFRDQIVARLPQRVALGFDAAGEGASEEPANVAVVQLDPAQAAEYARHLAQMGDATVQIPGTSARVQLTSWSYKGRQLGTAGVPGVAVHYAFLDGALALSRQRAALLELLDGHQDQGPDFTRGAGFEDFLRRMATSAHAVLVGHIPSLLAGQAGTRLAEPERDFLGGLELICSQYTLDVATDSLREVSLLYPKAGAAAPDAARQAETFARASIARFPAAELLKIESSFGVVEGRIEGNLSLVGVRGWVQELVSRISQIGVELPDLDVQPDEGEGDGGGDGAEPIELEPEEDGEPEDR